MIRSVARRVLLAAGRAPRYVTIGEPDPQQRVRVTLEGCSPARDVTRNHVVAALKPLIFAAAVPALPAERGAGASLALRFAPVGHPQSELGLVRLAADGAFRVNGEEVRLFRAIGSENACLRGLPAVVFRLWHAWSERRQRPRPTHWISRPDLAALQIVYACPRPVVLVSVEHGRANNLFPLDLIGPTAGPHFLLALRNTSPAVQLIDASRRVALADVPLELAAAARHLGVPHRLPGIDWRALPFETDPSPTFGLRVPRPALRVRELDVQDSRVVGSHTLFVTRVVHEEHRREGLRMAGLSGSYYRYLRLRGVEPPLAS